MATQSNFSQVGLKCLYICTTTVVCRSCSYILINVVTYVILVHRFERLAYSVYHYTLSLSVGL